MAQRPGAIIVGASSGIGAALARELAARGYALALVARRQPELDALAAEINRAQATGDAPIARGYVHDVRDYDAAPALYDAIERDLGGTPRVLVYSSGVMPDPAEGDRWTFEQERAMQETNVIGAQRWLGLAADHFQAAERGTLVGISSVAGERGRPGNAAYMASKAALTSYLDSLRYRLRNAGVRVVTVKPGYVDTPMVAGHKLPRPLVTSAEQVARRVADLCERGPSVAYVPRYWGAIMWVVRHAPSAAVARMPA